MSLSFQKPEHKEMLDFLGRVVGYYKQGRNSWCTGGFCGPWTSPSRLPCRSCRTRTEEGFPP